MEISNFICAGWVVVFVVPPLLLGSVCKLLNFWSRGSLNKSWGLSYQVGMYKLLPKGYKPEEDGGNGDFWYSYLVYNLMVGASFSFLLSKIVTDVPFQTVLYAIYIIATILTLLYLPRFIIDLTKGLKMNHKSGDLEEINSLKKRLEQLEKGE